MEHLSEAEHSRCVTADAAWKCSPCRWTNFGLAPPPSLLRREVEEFDLLHGLVPPPAPPVPPPQFEAGSSSGGWSSSGAGSSSPRTPLPAQPLAVDEDSFELYDPALFADSVTRDDFVPDEVLATVTSAVQARTAREVQDGAKRRRREVDLDELMLEQGLELDRLHHEQEAAKSRAKEKGKVVVVDLVDESEEEE